MPRRGGSTTPAVVLLDEKHRLKMKILRHFFSTKKSLSAAPLCPSARGEVILEARVLTPEEEEQVAALWAEVLAQTTPDSWGLLPPNPERDVDRPFHSLHASEQHS